MYTQVIESFEGEFRWLSNFEPCKMHHNDLEYETAEHAYQSSKTNSLHEKKAFTLSGGYHAGKAKRKGRKVTIRFDWEDVKLSVMEEILRIKFCPVRNPKLALKLFNTDPCILIEGNTWGDVFFGVCDGEGENHLGKILMKIRSDLLSYYTVVDI
jgi:ribA/ribD-fused uncharacterized protein